MFAPFRAVEDVAAAGGPVLCARRDFFSLFDVELVLSDESLCLFLEVPAFVV
jgi:hypothetical protein